VDPDRFDALARALSSLSAPAATGHRRAVLGFLVAGAGAAVLGRPASAVLGPGRPDCKATDQRCEGDRECCLGNTCRSRRCRCRPGYEPCGGGTCLPRGDCCIGAGGRCSGTGARCCGGSSCKRVGGRLICCGIANTHDCGDEGADEFCCSGWCGGNGKCAGA
jgi:hypothetical protein